MYDRKTHKSRNSTKKTDPAEVVGTLMQLSVDKKFKTYAGENTKMWNPNIITPDQSDQPMVYLNSELLGFSTRFEAEELRAALERALKFNGSDNMEAEGSYLVPYVHKLKEGSSTGDEMADQLGVRAVNFLQFSEKQFTDLQALFDAHQ